MDYLNVDQVDGVGVVTISRPEKRNALTLSILDGLAGAVEGEVAAGAVAVVVTGGNEVFSAGVDLDEIGQGVADVKVDDVLATTFGRLRAVSVPVVAAIEGACVGGAVELALTCDARVVADGGYFAVPATRLGLLYRPDGIASLVALVGRDTVARLFLFNERIGANQALAAGLATHSCAQGTAVASALALCSGVSRETGHTVRATKEFVNDLLSSDVDLAHWSARRAALLKSDERRDALNRAASRRRNDR